MYGFFYELRTNNNVQLATLWVGVVVFFIVNAVIFGFGGLGSPLSPLQQELVNFSFDHHWYDGVVDATHGLGEWLRGAAWTLWSVLLLWAIIWIPVAFSDEVAAGFRGIARRLRGGGQQDQDLPDARPSGASAPVPRVPGPSRQEGDRWGMHLVIAFVSDFVNEWIFSRRGRRS